jgi:hypothetical protein
MVVMPFVVVGVLLLGILMRVVLMGVFVMLMGAFEVVGLMLRPFCGALHGRDLMSRLGLLLLCVLFVV